ncbi:hypothetical protein KAX02_06410 [candidate division WOR-3 bacterium]|nr:hypothetical protein [candidate division WOR-3 bacterium]
MKTKEEIVEKGDKRITVGDCFFGEEPSEEDMQTYNNVLSDIKDILVSESSITLRTKRLLEEVLAVEFNEVQWLALVLIIAVHMDAAEERGAKKLAHVMSLLMEKD